MLRSKPGEVPKNLLQWGDAESFNGVYVGRQEDSTLKGKKMMHCSEGEEGEKEKYVNSHPTIDTTVGSVEPLMGLRLGKRTYFENNNSSHHSSSSSHVIPGLSKRAKPSSSRAGQVYRCQVDGCNLDLSSAKSYHQKHRVCNNHSKSPCVLVNGLQLRFCQQCSRFHSLSEFDEMKRSCRRRLSNHNARRRNPRQQCDPTPSLYDDEQQMSFVQNKGQLVPSKTASWESQSSKHTVGNELTSELEKSSLIRQLYLPNGSANSAEVFNLGAKGSSSLLPSHIPAEFCALSLLSSTYTGGVTFDPKFISSSSSNDNIVCANQSGFPETMLHDNNIPHQLIPFASTEYWQWQQAAPNLHAHHHHHHHHHAFVVPNADLFPDIQWFKAPCDPTDFYLSAFK
ncbi:unnamed protein product [Cuscuta campestris]|nr:unnamed protein product [Cuscuta campestris]